MNLDNETLFGACNGVPKLSVLAAQACAREFSTDAAGYAEEFTDVPVDFQARVINHMTYGALRAFRDTGKYDALLGGDKLEALILRRENHYRHLFAQFRNQSNLSEAHLTCEPVLDAPVLARALEPHEAAIPALFDLESRPEPGTPVTVSRDTFQTQFGVFTEDLLMGLNWSNVLTAGGCVLAGLQTLPAEEAGNRRAIRDYYHRKAYTSSDIDLFLYGLSEAQATEKLKEIIDVVSRNSVFPVRIVRSKYAVSICSAFPFRHVQVILRLYKTPAEILMGFDVDSCCVGYDGSDVWCLPRAYRALASRYNLVDRTRRSPTYESRLCKYSLRGFEVRVPGLELENVDPSIFTDKRLNEVTGLARLLMMSKYQSTTQRKQHEARLEQLRNFHKSGPGFGQFGFGFGRPRGSRQRSRLKRSIESDSFVAERVEEVEIQTALQASDYSCVFLPWGPKWNAERIGGMLKDKTRLLNSQFFDSEKKAVTMPCLVGRTLDDVIESPAEVPLDYNERSALGLEKYPVELYVTGPLSWVTEDPGRQFIGSFQPSTDDWDKDVYGDSVINEVLALMWQGQFEPAAAALAKVERIDTRDRFGRTVLHVAVILGAIDIARIALEAGAKLDRLTRMNQSCLHLAAIHRRPEMLSFVIDRAGKALSEQIDLQDERGCTALHYAALAESEANTQMIVTLLDHGASVDQVARVGGTALHIAVANNRLSLAKLLVSRKADVDAASSQSSMRAVHMAASNGLVEMMKFLISCKADINAQDSNNITPLILSLTTGDDEMLKTLIEGGADLNLAGGQTYNSMPPLCIAASRLNVNGVKILLEHGADTKITSSRGDTAIDSLPNFSGHRYSNEPPEAEIERQRKARALSNELRAILIDAGMTPRTDGRRHMAFGQPQQTQRFMLNASREADVKASAAEIEHAIRTNNRERLATVLASSPPLATFRSLAASETTSAINLALIYDSAEMVEMLQAAGADPLETDGSNRNALHIAAGHGRAAVLKKLLQRHPNFSTDERNMSPVNYALLFGHAECARLLIEAGNAAASTRGFGQLSSAIVVGYNGNTELLPLVQGLYDESSEAAALTAIAAAVTGHVEIFRGVFQACPDLKPATKVSINWHGVTMNATTSPQNTLAHIAARHNRRNILEALVDLGVSVSERDSVGCTPLHTACEFGDADTVAFLLDHGAAIDAASSSGWTPLAFAAANRDNAVEIMRLLISRGASVNGDKSNPRSPLAGALSSVNADAIRILAEAGVNIVEPVCTAKYHVLQVLFAGDTSNQFVPAFRRNAPRSPIGDVAECFALLLEHGVDLESISFHHNNSLLHQDTVWYNPSLMEAISKAFAHEPENAFGLTPFEHLATLCMQFEPVSTPFHFGSPAYEPLQHPTVAEKHAMRLRAFDFMFERSRQPRNHVAVPENSNTNMPSFGSSAMQAQFLQTISVITDDACWAQPTAAPSTL